MVWWGSSCFDTSCKLKGVSLGYLRTVLWFLIAVPSYCLLDLRYLRTVHSLCSRHLRTVFFRCFSLVPFPCLHSRILVLFDCRWQTVPQGIPYLSVPLVAKRWVLFVGNIMYLCTTHDAVNLQFNAQAARTWFAVRSNYYKFWDPTKEV